jgi:hypothetical protein
VSDIGYFEGWYFKQQKGDAAVAFIPALHTDGGRKSASLQIVTPDKAWALDLPRASVRVDWSSGRLPVIEAGGSVFSAGGLRLDLQHPELTVSGELRFGPLTPPKGDIMGPYRFVPLMECRHSVFSLTHTVAGSLTLNGQTLDFSDGAGYIEGDRGRSFPKRYLWTQCSWDCGSRLENRDAEGGGPYEDTKRISPPVGVAPLGDPQFAAAPCALMLSAAAVRPFGLPFIGCIGFVYFEGKEHRIATYRGAEIVELGGGRITVRQGDLTLTAQLLEHAAQSLRAPVSGNMSRLIRESLCCRVRYIFSVKDRVLFDNVTERASFEYEF